MTIFVQFFVIENGITEETFFEIDIAAFMRQVPKTIPNAADFAKEYVVYPLILQNEQNGEMSMEVEDFTENQSADVSSIEEVELVGEEPELAGIEQQVRHGGTVDSEDDIEQAHEAEDNGGVDSDDESDDDDDNDNFRPPPEPACKTGRKNLFVQSK